MEKPIEKETLRNLLDQFQININTKLIILKGQASIIISHISRLNLNQRDLYIVSKQFEKEIIDNIKILEEKFKEIISTVDLIYLNTDFLLETKYLEEIEFYYKKISLLNNEIKKYVFKENEIFFLEEGKIDTFKTDLTRLNINLKDSNKSIIKNLNFLFKAIKLVYNQYQLSISEAFQLALEKEIQKSTKNFYSERQKILSDYKNDFKEQKDEFAIEISNLNQTIQASQAEISNLKLGFEQVKNNNFELTTKINEYTNDINLLVGTQANKLNENLNMIIESLRLDFENKILEINDSYENAKKNYQNFTALAERAGVYGLTQNYAKKAKEEKFEYQRYRKFTTFSILSAIATTVSVILIPIVEHWGSSITMDSNYYFTLMARFTISVMFFILALYLSKQASKHYECYQENHRTYLQLAALEPYISRMTDEEQLNIRKLLVPIYFNQNKDGKFSSKEDEVKYNIFSSQLKNLKQMVRK